MANPFGLSEIQDPAPASPEPTLQANPYAAANIEADQRTALRVSVLGAMEANPDQAAKAAKLATQTGMPYGVVNANLPEVERSTTLFAYDSMIAESPKAARFLTIPQNAEIARDDVGTLKSIELFAKRLIDPSAFRNREQVAELAVGRSADFSALVKRIKTEQPGLDLDTVRSLAAQRMTVDNQSDLAGASAKPQPTVGNIARGLLGSENWNKIGANVDVMSADLFGFDKERSARNRFAAEQAVQAVKPGFTTSTGSGLYSGGVSLVQNTPGILASVILGNPAPGLAFAGASSGADQYATTRARGGTAGESALAGGLSGAIEVATEMLPMSFLVKKMGKAGVGEFFKGLLARELPSEQIATFAQDAADTAIANPNMTWTEFLQERPGAAYETLLATLVQSGAMAGASLVLQKTAMRGQAQEYQAQQADQRAQVLEGLQKTVEASKLIQRSPDTLRTFMQEMADGGVPMVFVDSAALVQAGVNMQALVEALPSLAGQLEAVESGGDLVIPTGELLVDTVGTEFAQPLIDHARTSTDSMSRAEAKVFMQEQGGQLNQEIERVLAERDNDAQFKADRDAVQTTLLAQLNEVKRFTPAVNQRYAELTSNFYAVMAARIGMGVQQFVDTYKLGFAGQAGVGGQVLDQRAPGTLFHGTSSNVQRFSRIEGGNMWGPGYYLTDNPDTASGYATGKAGNRIAPDGNAGPNVMPVRMSGELFNMAAPLDAKTLKRVEKALGQKLQDYTWPGMKNRDLRQTLFQNFTDQAGANAVLAKAGFAGIAEESGTAGPGRTVMAFEARHIASDFDGKVLQQSPIPNKPTVADALLALGQLDSTFQYPKSDSRNMAEIAAAKGLTVAEVDRNAASSEQWLLANTTSEGDGVLNWMVTAPGGVNATITQNGSALHLNVSAVGEGNGGSAIYDLAANFALNNGLKFIGDPNGVSHAAMRRRLENMLSSAVKYGTTDHLEPHPDQVKGNPEIGVPPLKWTVGDTAGNIELMVAASVAATEASNPTATSNVQYDAATQSFVDGDGKPLDAAGLRAMLSFDGRSRGTGQAGIATLQRNALYRALLSGPDARRSFLESVRGQSSGAGSDARATDGTFYQGRTLDQKARGQIAFGDDITKQASIVSMLKGADLSTFIHEGGHFFLEVQADLAARISARVSQGEAVTPGEQAIADDMDRILAWMGVKGSPELSPLGEWLAMPLDQKRPFHEQFARGFEAYAFEGKAPSLDLQKTFQTFRAWLVNVYRAMLKSVNASKTDIGNALQVELTPEVRSVMDRMLATSEQITEAEAARDMGPLFKTAEAAGMTADEYKAYHDQGMQATMDAVDELQGKGLRDMQWLQNARSRKLKEMQKRHDELRAQVTREVRGEVMAQPVYRAWTFLTAKSAKPDEVSEPQKEYARELADHKTKRGEAEQAALKVEREKLIAAHPEVKGLQRGPLIARNKKQMGIYVQQAMLDWDKSHPAPAKPPAQVVEVPPEFITGKLNARALRQTYGSKDDAVWHKLAALGMTREELGEHSDVTAERFGFTSGDELVHALAAAEPPKSVIEGMTDQRMLQEYGDLATPAGLERAADQAIHNEARIRFVATELRALQHAMNVREKAPGKKNTVDVLVQAAKEHAAAVVAKLKVRDIRPGLYTAAEVRSSKAAAKAIGDVAQATLHKRNQLINMYAAKAAYAAQDEVKAAVEYFRKFDGASLRAKLPSDYVAQIDMLLEKFDLRSQSAAQVDRTKDLRTWVQSRLNAGEVPNISEQLLTVAERKAYNAAINSRDDEGNLVYPDDDERIKLLADAIERSAMRSIKDMTVEEVRGLRDTIKQIEHLGRLKDKLLTNMQGASYAVTRDLLAATVVANAKEQGKNTRTDNTWLGSKIDGLKQFGASHIKPAIWMRIFDGGKDNGPWWATVVRPANERATFETTRRAKATNELMRILGPVLKDVPHLDKIGKGRFFPELNTSLNWEERMAFAFNYGNESNLQRLMGGGIANVTPALSMRQVQTVLNTLSAAEWTAVQGVWDHFESYRAEIGAKELRVNGVEPVWIDARPFSVKTSDGQTLDLRGGYFPVKFDSKTSLKAQQHSDAQAAKDAMKAAYSAATTQRSFTKERVEEVTGRALLLNLQGLYSGVNDVIHDLAWHEWVIDVNRLLRSSSIDSAIREHYGANVKKELTKWRDDIVAGSQRLDHGLENAAGWARKFVSSAALTYNVISALMQPLGITQSFSRVGAKWVGLGLSQYLAGPVDATRLVQGKSEYMTNRTRTMFRDVNELRNRVAGQTTARELMGRYGYFLTMHFQMMVDVPTWIGAYEKGLAEGHSEDVAIALADQSVKDSQGGGEEVDQSGITRGGPLIKLFTAFYDFMNTQANVLYLKNATATGNADRFMHMAAVGLVSPMLAAALRDALIAGDSGEWDDWEKVVKKLLSEGLGNLIGMVAFGREFAQVAKALYGDDKGMGYSGPAGLRLIPDTFKLAKQANQGELDDAFRKAFVNVLGDIAGFPAVQINRTITGVQALRDGKTTNPGAILTGYQEP